MKSWKTTVAGAIGALGVYLTSVTDPSWVHTLGTVLSAVGTGLVGILARDNDKTSEQAGAK